MSKQRDIPTNLKSAVFLLLLSACTSVNLDHFDVACESNDDCMVVPATDVCDGCANDAIAKTDAEEFREAQANAKQWCFADTTDAVFCGERIAVCEAGACVSRPAEE